MATVAEIEQQIAALRARLGSLENAKITVQAEIERLQFQAVDLRSAARRQREGGDIAGADALRAQAQALDDRAAALEQPVLSKPTAVQLDYQGIASESREVQANESRRP